MRAGFSKKVITPPAGLRMSGYRLRRAPGAGVHDDLQARCTFIDHEGAVFALISLDLIGLEYRHAAAIKGRVEERCGLRPERILLGCTHTHSGPDTLHLHGSEEKLQHYCRELYDAVAECTAEARECLEPATLSLAQCEVPGLAFNRRILLRDGTTRLNLERIEESRIAAMGPVDQTASILLFSGHNGITGAIANFTLHATVLDQNNLLYSRDWPGYLVDALETALPGKPRVLFFNGAFGNVNQIETPGIWVSSFEEAERIGRSLADGLVQAARSKIFLPEVALHAQHAWLTIPRRMGRKPEEIKEEIARIQTRLDGAAIEERRSILAKELIFLEEERQLGRESGSEQVEIQRITLGGLEIIGIPGEIFVEYGLELKRESPFTHCLVFGNVNGSAGYIPMPESFTEGAYETRLSRGSRLVPEAGVKIVQAVENMRGKNTRSQI